MKYTEQDYSLIRKEIWNNAYDLFLNYSVTDDPNLIIKKHKKFINSYGVSWNKKKFKSIDILNTFLKTKNKHLAEQQFYNSILKKIK